MFKIIYGKKGKSINERFPTRGDAEAYLECNRLDEIPSLRGQDDLNFEVVEIESSPEERILLLEEKVFALTRMCQSFIKGHRRSFYYAQKLKELEGGK